MIYAETMEMPCEIEDDESDEMYFQDPDLFLQVLEKSARDCAEGKAVPIDVAFAIIQKRIDERRANQ